MTAKNVLFILSDEHARGITGCYGNNAVKTPNIDALAAAGTTFENAYCNNPICVPSRASLATGRHTHEIGFWDNAQPYDGSVRGWAHALSEAGHRVASIGKLHYRDADAPVGFTEQILPMHVVEGKGDLHGLLRSPPRIRPSMKNLSAELGPGDSDYSRYDSAITDAACRWIAERARKPDEKPWAAFVSLACPHFPLVAPKRFFDLYDPAKLPWPKGRDGNGALAHPVLAAFRKYQNYDDYFTGEEHVRLAVASYYALVSFLDHNIGRILESLSGSGLTEDTLVIYTSDHGDNLGARGFWGKSLLFEESVGVPMIMAGPGVPRGRRVATPVSLVDVAPTIMDAACEEVHSSEATDLPGRSLLSIAGDPDDPDRTVLAEYHAVGSITGCFMIRFDRWKYIHFVDYPPLLYDLKADPEEMCDLAEDSEYAGVRSRAEARLRAIVDPEKVSARAFADQQRIIERNGGIERILSRGEFPHTPVPYADPSFN
ncbi:MULTISPECIES: sulfatase-like hydrolase/transferase [Chelativorans]|uniref:Sulfatase-like hydrolase/transferase n=1 Tax=Chelativorans intermedius TaxID=515947 RepID=A0ABV6DD97_9HYPH|nr:MULTISPECIES: sulfatase-like hydrolase/transferase [Chelativorans]MCT9000568.1 sulfatase-like hydrolase/transferase [Chelativorans intermedius]WEX12188.1 sulfatase-like hydrolase/transferase [Chelativorans sp. AA-79]